MFALVIGRYRRPLEEVIKSVEEHRAYLRELKKQGLLIAAGPMDPWTGGALLLRVPDNDVAGTLDRIRDGDPYWQKGLVQYEFIPWKPMIGKDELDRL